MEQLPAADWATSAGRRGIDAARSGAVASADRIHASISSSPAALPTPDAHPFAGERADTAVALAAAPRWRPTRIARENRRPCASGCSPRIAAKWCSAVHVSPKPTIFT